MKRLLKWLAIGIGGVVLVVVVFGLSGYLLPVEVELDLEESVTAPPGSIFSLFTTYDGVERWWRRAAQEMGDDLHITHVGGSKQGVGMEIGFGAAGGPVVENWTYTSVQPQRVEIDVDFQIFMSHRVLELTPEGTGTKVRWHETARVERPVWRWMLKLNNAATLENRRIALLAAGGAASPPR